MAQVDWLAKFAEDGVLQPGDSMASTVTSGDINSVVIHLFYVSQHWQRMEDGKFPNPVFVILQKPSGSIVYNVTSIVETLEQKYPNDPFVATKLGLVLCVGGNDFIPKLEFITHKTVCQLFFQEFLDTLFTFSDGCICIQSEAYIEFVKCLYCKKSMGDPKQLSFENVRRATILSARKVSVETPGTSNNVRNPNRWMPPKTH